MSMEVRLRPRAINDLVEIFDYVSTENPVAAARIVDEIEAFCMSSLSDNPHIGTAKDEIVADIRIFPVAGYRVCYFVRDSHIDVVRILHQARDVPRHLRRR